MHAALLSAATHRLHAGICGVLPQTAAVASGRCVVTRCGSITVLPVHRRRLERLAGRNLLSCGSMLQCGIHGVASNHSGSSALGCCTVEGLLAAAFLLLRLTAVVCCCLPWCIVVVVAQVHWRLLYHEYSADRHVQAGGVCRWAVQLVCLQLLACAQACLCWL